MDKCKANNTALPNVFYLTDERRNYIPFTNGNILAEICNISKSNGHDEIQSRILKLCEDITVAPLNLVITKLMEVCSYS